jgi:hypothetical protein
LTIERRGWLRLEQVVRDGRTGDVVARVRQRRKQTVLELDGKTAEWRPLGSAVGKQLASMAEFGFVSGGEPLLTARLTGGLVRLRGEITIAPALAEAEGLVLALLAAYLLIRGNEQAVAMKAMRS